MDLRTNPDGSISLRVPASYAPTLGSDGLLLLDWYSSALIALSRLRAGDPQMTSDGWHALLNDLERRLAPRLQGIRDALIRAHAAAGGTYSELALALDVSKGGAQYRRDKVTATPPSHWERWATGTIPGVAPAADWQATVTLIRAGQTTPEHVEVAGLTAMQAGELETLVADHSDEMVVTVTNNAGHAYAFSAPDVQMVKVSHTVDRSRAEAHAALCATGCHAYAAGKCRHCGHPRS